MIILRVPAKFLGLDMSSRMKLRLNEVQEEKEIQGKIQYMIIWLFLHIGIE